MIGILRSLLGLAKNEEIDERIQSLAGRCFCLFGFKPYLLTELEYRCEVLLVIHHRALCAEKSGKDRNRNYSDKNKFFAYREALDEYREAVLVAQRLHDEFRDLPLHWTKFQDFLDVWCKRSGCDPRSRSTIRPEII